MTRDIEKIPQRISCKLPLYGVACLFYKVNKKKSVLYIFNLPSSRKANSNKRAHTFTHFLYSAVKQPFTLIFYALSENST